MEKSALPSCRMTPFETLGFVAFVVRVAPKRRRVKMAGLRLGNTAANRSPKTSRLKPVGGESPAAPSSRQNPGVSPPPSSSRLAIRNSTSPIKVPPMPLATLSLIEGGVVSPYVSQRKLPPTVYNSDCQ